MPPCVVFACSREYVHLLENDALSVGGTTEGGELESSAEGLLLVVLVSPTVLTASGAELASGLETSWFSFTYWSTWTHCCISLSGL